MICSGDRLAAEFSEGITDHTSVEFIATEVCPEILQASGDLLKITPVRCFETVVPHVDTSDCLIARKEGEACLKVLNSGSKLVDVRAFGSRGHRIDVWSGDSSGTVTGGEVCDEKLVG